MFWPSKACVFLHISLKLLPKCMMNMKTLLLVLLVSTGVYAQQSFELDPETGQLKAEAVVEVAGTEAGTLHTKVYDWFGKAFAHPDEVIQSNSPNGIRGRYIHQYTYMMTDVDFYHDISVDVKNGKYRIVITNILTRAGVDITEYVYKKNGNLRGSTSKLQAELDAHLSGMVEGLNKAVTAKDDW